MYHTTTCLLQKDPYTRYQLRFTIPFDLWVSKTYYKYESSSIFLWQKSNIFPSKMLDESLPLKIHPSGRRFCHPLGRVRRLTAKRIIAGRAWNILSILIAHAVPLAVLS